MCGIVGYINFSETLPQEVIYNMTQMLHHRGPDDYGVKSFKNSSYEVALGQKRLSILDVSADGHQPMQYEHYWIVYNGEIYNFKEIKEKLENLGHQFVSKSDTEVILHAFKEWGEQAVDQFIGMFAFMIYNEKQEEFYIYRDRAGVKPLYYYENDKGFMFASELKAFHKHPNFKKEIDLDAMAQFFKYEFIHAPNSIFKNVKKLLPGHFLKYDIKSKSFTIHQYWNVLDFYKKPNLNVTYQEAKAHLKVLMKDAFMLRMVSDVPVGVFLSGGYDSSIVTAIIQELKSQKLKTFTIGFDDKKYDESKYAKEVADLLNTDHHSFTCTDKEALSIIPKLADYFDEPFADPSLIPTMLLSQRTEEKVKVSLSADGGDEIFYGYNRYEKIYKYYHKMKRLGPFSKVLSFIKRKKFTDKFYAANISNKNATVEMLDIHHQKYKDAFINDLFVEKINKLPNNFTSSAYDDIDKFHRILAVDYTTYLPDNILVKVDRATMSASLEGREPLLDHRIVEYAAQLPLEYLFDVKTKTKKHILRDICHDYLPKDLMSRKKTGFTPPIVTWLRTELKEFVDSTLSKEELNKHGLLNIDVIEKAKEDYFEGNDTFYNLIWNTLVFQLWYNKWMLDE
ncbi:asparagine synthase (glutamine-hydrolyzing) [Winogradskyella forsetii]|uniref:asparagine synthase (glutamine-hydrolyzing) n=1 Tax=Winogradskyella forsetii TaxID=2686077 RepID=UPI0015BB8B93|nr:asparagine synthase (glutamine-hydrolyzing) [Winogradskyella forsetii]